MRSSEQADKAGRLTTSTALPCALLMPIQSFLPDRPARIQGLSWTYKSPLGHYSFHGVLLEPFLYRGCVFFNLFPRHLLSKVESKGRLSTSKSKLPPRRSRLFQVQRNPINTNARMRNGGAAGTGAEHSGSAGNRSEFNLRHLLLMGRRRPCGKSATAAAGTVNLSTRPGHGLGSFTQVAAGPTSREMSSAVFCHALGLSAHHSPGLHDVTCSRPYQPSPR